MVEALVAASGVGASTCSRERELIPFSFGDNECPEAGPGMDDALESLQPAADKKCVARGRAPPDETLTFCQSFPRRSRAKNGLKAGAVAPAAAPAGTAAAGRASQKSVGGSKVRTGALALIASLPSRPLAHADPPTRRAQRRRAPCAPWHCHGCDCARQGGAQKSGRSAGCGQGQELDVRRLLLRRRRRAQRGRRDRCGGLQLAALGWTSLLERSCAGCPSRAILHGRSLISRATSRSAPCGACGACGCSARGHSPVEHSHCSAAHADHRAAATTSAAPTHDGRSFGRSQRRASSTHDAAAGVSDAPSAATGHALAYGRRIARHGARRSHGCTCDA